MYVIIGEVGVGSKPCVCIYHHYCKTLCTSQINSFSSNGNRFYFYLRQLHVGRTLLSLWVTAIIEVFKMLMNVKHMLFSIYWTLNIMSYRFPYSVSPWIHDNMLILFSFILFSVPIRLALFRCLTYNLTNEHLLCNATVVFVRRKTRNVYNDVALHNRMSRLSQLQYILPHWCYILLWRAGISDLALTHHLTVQPSQHHVSRSMYIILFSLFVSERLINDENDNLRLFKIIKVPDYEILFETVI